MKKTTNWIPALSAAILMITSCGTPKTIDTTGTGDIMAMARTDVQSQSFYKEVFLDAGCSLSNLTNNPENPNSLELDRPAIVPKAYRNLFGEDTWRDHVEYLWVRSSTDSVTQNLAMVGSENDVNGMLLYPDGEPRFKVMYSYGGKSGKHGKSLGEEGRERVRTFFANGGSYTGSCAGTILAAPYWGDKPQPNVYGIHEGAHYAFSGWYIGPTYYHKMNLVPGNPLEKYFKRLSGKSVVDSVRHNGGCVMREDSLTPAGTEIIGRYGPVTEGCVLPQGSNPTGNSGKPCMWAWKKNQETGRLVVCGSHPESCTTEDVTELYQAQISYAMDGFGNAKPKAVLENGMKRIMGNSNDPLYAGIGDRQYHHYLIYLPKRASKLRITLHCNFQDAHLELAMKRDTYAFADSEPEYSGKASEDGKSGTVTLTAKKVPAGLWYVSVHCPIAPEAIYHNSTRTHQVGGYIEYTGNEAEMATLNGIAYDIAAEWK